MKSDINSRTLALAHLAIGWPKLSAAMGQLLAESASVCLHDQGHGEESIVKTRMKQKLRQSNPSDDTQTSAYAIVVEFSEPMARIQTK